MKRTLLLGVLSAFLVAGPLVTSAKADGNTLTINPALAFHGTPAPSYTLSWTVSWSPPKFSYESAVIYERGR